MLLALCVVVLWLLIVCLFCFICVVGSFYVCWFMLCVVCCLLSVICCLLFGVCCLLCCMLCLSAVVCLLFVGICYGSALFLVWLWVGCCFLLCGMVWFFVVFDLFVLPGFVIRCLLFVVCRVLFAGWWLVCVVCVLFDVCSGCL